MTTEKDDGAGGPTHSMEVTQAAVSSDYKVRGKKAATSGTGVLGHNTATSGTATGVEGVTESADDTVAAGVRGLATASGTAAATRGVLGISRADSDLGNGIIANGVKGIAEGTGGTSGVTGISPNDSIGTGVFGLARWRGVWGRTDSATDGATGVYGSASATTVAETYGVRGVSAADADHTTTPEVHPAGVRGRSSGSGVTYGVRGDTASANGRGVIGFATSDAYSHDAPPQLGAGVMGVTDRSGAHAALEQGIGVLGWSTAASGKTFGVIGRTENSDQGFGVAGVDATGNGVGVFSAGTGVTDGRHHITGGVVHAQRGDPTTDELPPGEVMTYNSDGSGTGNQGDLVYAINDAGTVKTQVIAARSDAT